MGITATLAVYATQFIASTGYITVFLGMVLESMIFPLPSEAIMPFAGFLVAEGRFDFLMVVLISTFGSLVGSLLSYWLGKFGGKPFVHKFGKYFLIDQAELDITEKFFHKNGQITVFICRFIPVIRHLISLPAGIAKMNIWKFIYLTAIGACLWNSFLTYLGYVLRQNWELVLKYSEVIDIVIVLIILVLIGLFIYRQLHKMKTLKKLN
jgi:membrane protein DedA with SNARE-associated domain